MLADIANPKTVITCLHQQTKDRQPGVVAESRKGASVWAGRGHGLNIATFLVVSISFSKPQVPEDSGAREP